MIWKCLSHVLHDLVAGLQDLMNQIYVLAVEASRVHMVRCGHRAVKSPQRILKEPADIRFNSIGEKHEAGYQPWQLAG
ncbi:hypothetical protein Xlen_02610 [Xanthomonas campestris pv. leeana]|nr:hypothetical protein WS7_14764 [Xanthomonas citri pv. malvacearum str. GSPB2388]OOW63337.1 hypothetical protein Xths_02975 [Xanthomonas campestris pv. thespesiae]OOW78368.1 hypothetical protein Xlen_02610 [Xanthomonas campestris pv. leeana]